MALIGRFLMATMILGVLYYAIIPERTYFYRSVRDKSTSQQGNYITLRGRTKFWFASTPDFLIREGKLYLLTRQTSSFPFFLAVSKRDTRWTVVQLQTLSSAHNELKGMWPDPVANNLGIDWVEAQKAKGSAIRALIKRKKTLLSGFF
jgi:hypothetical protein